MDLVMAEREEVPGPGAYSATRGIGQPGGRGQPSARFGGEPRLVPPPDTSKHSPGPGTYNVGGGLGPQTSKTMPSPFSATLTSRVLKGAEYPLFFDPGSDEADTMGPGRCRSDSFLQRSTSPNQRWAPIHSFGGAKIVRRYGTDVPGPGTYDPRTSALSRQVISTQPSGPSFSLSSRQERRPYRISDNFAVREDDFTKHSSYEPPKGFTFGGRHVDPNALMRDPPVDTPGPGAYGEDDVSSYD